MTTVLRWKKSPDGQTMTVSIRQSFGKPVAVSLPIGQWSLFLTTGYVVVTPVTETQAEGPPVA